jgi:hypothetical protein
MSIPIFDTISFPSYFTSAQQGLIDRLRIEPRSTNATLPRVVYVDRQSSGRRLKGDAHKDLLDVMYRLQGEGKVDFWHMPLEDYTPEEQVTVMVHTDVSVTYFVPETLPCRGERGHGRELMDRC